MSSEEQSFQLGADAAESYERAFVPALFAAWAAPLVEAARVVAGQAVLDVACGTGIVARHAAERLGGHGQVIGVDLNPHMLAVARRVAPDLDWRQGDAAALPLPDRSVDVVLCQAALMFFPDPAQALREMARVVRPTGTVGLQVWDTMQAQTGWAPFYDVVSRHAGSDATAVLGSYWRLGDLDELNRLCEQAGLRVSEAITRQLTAAFPSVEEFVATEITGTPLQSRIGPDTYTAIVADARTALAPFLADGGALRLPIQGHILVAEPDTSDHTQDHGRERDRR